MPRSIISPFEVSRAQVSQGGLWLEAVNVVFGADLTLLGFTRSNTDSNETCEVDTRSAVELVYFGRKIYPWDNSVVFTLGVQGVGASMCTIKSATGEPSTTPSGSLNIPFDTLYPGVARIELQFLSSAVESTSTKSTVINQLKDYSVELQLLPPEYLNMLPPTRPTDALELDIKTQLIALRGHIVAKTEQSQRELESILKQNEEDIQCVFAIDAILANLSD